MGERKAYIELAACFCWFLDLDYFSKLKMEAICCAA
jgi:hypothetical protein